jgi:hypothetical protein
MKNKKHVSINEMYKVFNEGYPCYDSPRNSIEEHIEVCEECQRTFGELKKFFEETKEVV